MGGDAGWRRRRSVPPVAVANGPGRPCHVCHRGFGPCLAVCRSGLDGGALAIARPRGLAALGGIGGTLGLRGRSTALSGAHGRMVGLALRNRRGRLHLRHEALARESSMDPGVAPVPFPARMGVDHGEDGGRCIPRVGAFGIPLGEAGLEPEWSGSFRLRQRRVPLESDIGRPFDFLPRVLPRTDPPRLARGPGHAGGSVLAECPARRFRGPRG